MIELAGYPSKGNAVDTIVSFMSDMATVRYELVMPALFRLYCLL